MKKTELAVPKPKVWLYYPLRGACRLLARGAFRLKVTGRKALPRKGPLLVMATHQGMLDPIFVFAALRRKGVHFVATQRQFRNPTLRWVYQRMGAIPKTQFRSDPRCVMRILRVLRGGDTVVVFPTGQTCTDGTPGAISPAMARLVKKAGVPVCTVGLRGAFFTAPRYGGLRFGRTEARLEMAFTPEQLRDMSESQIYEALCRKLTFDEYEWQASTGARFRGKDLTRGYEELLVCCPKCGGVDCWQSEGNTVTCTLCGNKGIVGRDMRMRPAGEGDRVFETLTQWQQWQEEQLARGLEAPDFLLEEPVTAMAYDEETQQYRQAGQGLLRLDSREIRFEGRLDGKEECLAIPHSLLPGLSCQPGVYVELYHEGYGLMHYVPADHRVVGRMKILQEHLYRQSLEQ